MSKKPLIMLGAVLLIIVAILLVWQFQGCLKMKGGRMNNKQLKPITQDDFVLQRYEWTKVSRYAVTADGVLVRDDSEEAKTPFYMCLWEGWWEPQGLPGVGVGIRCVLEAKPISIEKAKEIMRREEKPVSERPEERKNWRFD